MSRSGIGKSSVAIESLTTGSIHVEARVLVANLFLEIHRDAADSFSYAFETLEVDLDVVIDVDTEIGLNRIDKALCAIGAVLALRERRIDTFLVTRRLNRNPKISRERHEINGFVLRINSGDHDRVRALTSFLDALTIQECRRVVVGL